ncbi:sensor histidine kinase [Oceanispirochaeta crateris]|nr:histidine kinase [Oceanispirochaeta crateris]
MIILCNFAIVALFIFNQKSFLFPVSWTYQFLTILVFNFFTSLLIFFIPEEESSSRGILTAFLFILQLGCKYIMTKPFSTNIWFEFFLIIIMLLESIILLTTAETLLLTTVIMSSILFTDHNEIFWGIEAGTRTWDLKGSLLILTLLISILCIIIKYAHNLLLQYREIQTNQRLIIQKLSTSNSELQQYANIAEEKSMVHERLKMTREIHDTVGYTLTNLLMMLEASTDLVKTNPVKLEKLLNQALEIIKTGHSEIRQSLRILRNTKVKEKNSIESIQNLTGIFMESTGVNVRVEFGNLPWVLNRKIDHIIYRFLQEAMTNALTHGDAKNISIQFWRNEGLIQISIEDDGKGSLDIEQGIGLKGMTERLAEVDGSLSYENTSMGFSIRAVIPWSYDE